MKFFSKALFASAAVFILAPTSALALRPDCDVTCFETTPCSTYCTKPWTSQLTTCGVWVATWGQSYPENSCAPSLGPASDDDEAAFDEAAFDEAASVVPGQDSVDGSQWVCREPASAARS
ncbi:hypothetical protein JY651_07005 [Pyxidicoccus parkwayensis]|jgi:hypothetical protein|uniref:Uncharacterized protein n=1 Tax=Pyxidicoccus parkwayensis TaxID=2813578 RepID=A0ABX7P2D6_9BACT|nr:hypothetical protein [Pyxidicoccus parkwaysis]QSQ24691.1 hypothetical protein JY651_07005 [Pyxidicoccus parkwaysis]